MSGCDMATPLCACHAAAFVLRGGLHLIAAPRPADSPSPTGQRSRLHIGMPARPGPKPVLTIAPQQPKPAAEATPLWREPRNIAPGHKPLLAPARRHFKRPAQKIHQ